MTFKVGVPRQGRCLSNTGCVVCLICLMLYDPAVPAVRRCQGAADIVTANQNCPSDRPGRGPQSPVHTLYITSRPPLDKKVFPVHRPGGLKRDDWDFFFMIFEKSFFFLNLLGTF